MSLEKIEKLRDEIEKLEEEYNRTNLDKVFDKGRHDQVYKKLKKKRKELKELEESTK
ncbi:MAG: hypothetical protein KKG33_08150 [candidate division Zixibacteria bacterium]|nr:hypothetical protein [candidate division Zixibacteria bacterium]MBU1470537.1 hypothetical protein [candidate division Zixibacteria bacterium]MBU2625519.1 hypothetical protein [candidate division Zixibacteria bacterium]